MKTKYKAKMRLVCIILTVCFLFLIGGTLSRVGILALSEDDYKRSVEAGVRIKEDRVNYERILGNIYDESGAGILVNDSVIQDAVLDYDKSYSHLLGNICLDDNGLLNQSYDVLTAENSGDSVRHKGYSLSLTLNDELQRFAYSLTEGTRAGIVVLKRHSGEIRALTSTYEEDFDLSGEPDGERLARYNNAYEPVWLPEYLNAYAPGSCQKVFSSAVAFESGMGGYTIDDTGSIKYGKDEIQNFGGYIYGYDLDITDAFCVSANTYFASLFNDMEVGKIRKRASALLLNGSITTDFGTVRNSFSFGDYSKHEIGLLGIGQMNELSSVGLAMMVQGCIDNEVYCPHVLKSLCVTKGSGELKDISKTEEKVIASGIFSNDTCSRVRKLMETAARSENYLLDDSILGAKSGTADVKINDEDTNRASLVAYNEKYIVVVSKIEDDAFGIENKEILEKVFNKLSDVDANTKE